MWMLPLAIWQLKQRLYFQLPSFMRWFCIKLTRLATYGMIYLVLMNMFNFIQVMHVLGFDPHAFSHFRDDRKRRRSQVDGRYTVGSIIETLSDLLREPFMLPSIKMVLKGLQSLFVCTYGNFKWIQHLSSPLHVFQVTEQLMDEKLGRMVTRVVLPRVVMHSRNHYGVSIVQLISIPRKCLHCQDTLYLHSVAFNFWLSHLKSQLRFDKFSF